jgi:transcriptional regulator with XRE-family HTH domain
MTGAAFNPGTELGPRLRRVRQDRGLSARELARRISCSPSLISQIERGVSVPSVGMLYALASELRASMDFLFGVIPSGELTMTAHGGGRARDAAAADPAPWPGGHGIIQRAGSRRTIDLASGVRWERLTPGADDLVDFLEVVYEPRGRPADSRRALRHDGYEYGLVVSGTLQARVGFERYELGEGDSIAFDSATPHEYWNATPEEVRAVWAVVHAQHGRP